MLRSLVLLNGIFTASGIIGLLALPVLARGGGHISGGFSHASASPAHSVHMSRSFGHGGRGGRGWGWGGDYQDDSNPYAWGAGYMGGGRGVPTANELDRYNRAQDTQRIQLSRATCVQEYNWPKSDPSSPVEVNACAPVRRDGGRLDTAGLIAAAQQR